MTEEKVHSASPERTKGPKKNIGIQVQGNEMRLWLGFKQTGIQTKAIFLTLEQIAFTIPFNLKCSALLAHCGLFESWPIYIFLVCAAGSSLKRASSTG